VSGASREAAITDLGWLAFGTAVYQGGRFALTVAAAAILGPADFGIWTLLMVLLAYSGALSLGIPNGLGREVPFLVGAGRSDDALAIEDRAWTGALLTGVLAAAVAAGAGWIVVMGHDQAALLVVVTMAAALLQQPWLLVQIQLRSRMLFRPASLQLAAQGVVALGAGLLLLGLGLGGLWASQALVLLAGIALGLRALPGRPHARLDLPGLRHLAAIGAPVMAAGLLFGLLTTIDRWFVAGAVGEAAVGHYGLAGLATSALLMIPAVVSPQTYPHLSFALGEGASGRSLADRAARAGLVSAALVAAAAVVVAGLAVVAIPTFLPQYEASIGPILVLLPGLVIYAGCTTHADLLNAMRAHWLYLRIQALALVVDVILLVVLVGGGLGVVGAAVATSTAVGGYGIALVVAGRRLAVRRGLTSDAAAMPRAVPPHDPPVIDRMAIGAAEADPR
jgi:O-antigen/teichoic acid export membrane protein